MAKLAGISFSLMKASSELEHPQMKSLSGIGVSMFCGGQAEAQF
jgi:hypothetical protein